MFLAIDCSTQSMSGMLYDSDQQEIILSISINFASRFSQYSFAGDESCDERVVNPLLWVLALDELFQKIANTGIDLSKLEGISGAAQQHATIYVNQHFKKTWEWKHDLFETVKPMLSIERSPIWMDHSTSIECQEINAGLPANNYAITTSGSSITERFSGPQIRRFAKHFPQTYLQTKVIHLLSSFLTCLLVGKNGSIEFGDASGMNLFHLKKLKWDEKLINATDDKLSKKLPALTHGDQIAGKISPYFVTKYGINQNAFVTYFTGDNISSAIGLGCHDSSMAVISLGTSDTMFICNDTFGDSTNSRCNTFFFSKDKYLSLLCIQNGAFARDKARESLHFTWEQFDQILLKSNPGNNGVAQLPFYTSEINPYLPQGKRTSNKTRELTSSEMVRSVLESQAINMKIQAKTLSHQFNKIFLTGGGANCDGFCRIIADVFQCDVIRTHTVNSALLGGIVRAAASSNNKKIITGNKIKSILRPRKETREIYQKLEKVINELIIK